MHGSTIEITANDGSQGWRAGVRAAIAKLKFWHRRITTRRALRELELHRLGDVGLSEHDRRRECGKWFWQD